VRVFLCALLVAFGLGMAVAGEPPTPATFTARFAEALQAALPSAKVSIVRDLQLDIRRTDGTSATVSLVNNYRDYSADPKWFVDVVKAYAAALAKPAGKQAAKHDRTRIVPVIKDRPWLAELQGQFRQQDASQQPVFEDFNNELVVVYAEDTSDRTRYLSSSESLGVERSKLRALAVDNLMRIMPRIDLRQGGDGLAMMTSHADYGASLLLVDSIWAGDQIKVDGDIVVAVPAKDVILITGSRNRKGLKAMRTAAPKLARGSYGITETLFVYRKGRFVKFGRD
jgi:uncharacterized protein YtpQ (UPF0354 family)